MKRLERVWCGSGLAGVAGVVMISAGCAGPGLSAGFDAPDPGARLHAIVAAAERGDRGAIPRLVSLLESDDPATRLLAIRTLERLTGQTMGYEHAGPQLARREAQGRWEAWLVEEGYAVDTAPADGDDYFVRPSSGSGTERGSPATLSAPMPHAQTP